MLVQTLARRYINRPGEINTQRGESITAFAFSASVALAYSGSIFSALTCDLPYRPLYGVGGRFPQLIPLPPWDRNDSN